MSSISRHNFNGFSGGGKFIAALALLTGRINYTDEFLDMIYKCQLQVVNKDDTPLPGLYAVGVDTGGWEAGTYNAHLSGSAFGFALNSGRIAGENAAAYSLV